jgi:hypothetical protein
VAVTAKKAGRATGREVRRPAEPLALVAIGLLFLAPLMIVPGALDRFVFGKLTVAALGAGLAFWAAPRGRLNRRVVVIVGAGAVVLLLAAIFASSPEAAILGRAPRYEGGFVLATYVAVAVAAARLMGPDRDDHAVRLGLRVLAAVAILVAVIAILESAGLRPLSSDVSRPGSLFGNASDEGAFGVLALGPLAAVGLRRRDPLLSIGAAAALGVTVLSASRGAMAAVIVEITVLAIVLGGRRVAAAAAAAVLLAVGLSFAVPASRSRILDQSPLARHTVSGRRLLWSETAHLDLHHLALGVGPSNFEVGILREHDLQWQQQVGPANPPDSPHNWLLQATSAGGLPLLLLSLALAGTIMVSGWRAARRERASAVPLLAGSFAAVVAYGVVLLVHLTSPGPTALAALLTGPLVARSATSLNSANRKIGDLAVGTAMFALTVIFLAAGIAEIPLRHAIVSLSQGHDAAAESSFNAVRDLRPWDVDLPDTAGHAFVTVASTASDPEAAKFAGIWLRRVPGSLADDEQVRLDVASLEELRGQYAAAAQVLANARAVDPDNPLVILRQGVVAAESHEDPRAVTDFRRAATISPSSPQPWKDLAIVYGQEGRTVAARRAQDRANLLMR